ncbi:MAG: ABC transporter substrate-binding protein [Eubacteriales bacterium]|nr:ABC transporter substrate-binding protein [Eubacteriales bacterium]
MKKKIFSLIMAACVVMTAGCGGNASTQTAESTDTQTVSSIADRDTLNIVLADEIVSLDPAYSYDNLTNQVVNQITQGLLYFDYSGQLQPQLCSSWEAVDSTTYVYQIRDDVCFSDGSPMTMEDVLFSLNRHMDEDVASYLAWMYANVDSIEQTGDWEITVHLSVPDAAWQYAFATTAGHIISKEYYEANAEQFGQPGVGVIGTGPYVLDSWTTGSEIKLTYNENYWDKENVPQFKNIDFKIITDANTQATTLASGQADYMFDPPTEMLDTIREAENMSVTEVDGWTVLWMAMNCQSGPFSDVNVRKAVAYALDKDSLYEGVLTENGSYAKNGMPFSSALYGSESESWTAYAETAVDEKNDIEKAKEYLAQSAYPDGFECSLYINQDSIYNSIAVYVQSALSQIGIDVTIETKSGDEMSNIQFGSTRDYDLAIVRWTADYPDVSGQLYPLFHSSNIAEGGGNTSCYSNPEVDALLEAEVASIDMKERTELMQQALTIIANDTPMIGFDYPYKRVAMNSELTGFEANASITWNFFAKDLKTAE